MRPYDIFDSVYEKGFAVGTGQVKTDTMLFRYRDEVFEFPTLLVHPMADWNGYFYEVPVEKLRALKIKNGG